MYPSINKKYAIHEFIKDLEKNNRNFNDACKSKIRSEAVLKLENFLANNINNNNDKLALNNYNKTIDFCKNSPNIVFTKADKGNVTVALDKSDYISSDSNLPLAYGLTKIHKDNYPLRIIVSSINTVCVLYTVWLHFYIKLYQIAYQKIPLELLTILTYTNKFLTKKLITMIP
ncbi:hypothetical protein ALC62_03219 [Cyphomyrmex costatus]|uniref:Uncharacterized protein n=1 Tax=Cyphomyrmex costatus TaxID=456900 RepID=A0A151ILV1_9HYME|nr:hypothetical protein ALC62_03219 [Cyphomyrmex costatus]